MVPSLVPSLSATVVLFSSVFLANAHQVVLLPTPTYTTDDKDTKYAPLAFLEDQGFATQEDFTAWRQNNGYDSLRAFNNGASYTVSEGADFTCGFTNINGDAQPIPDRNAMRSTGYTHDGPCEVWLDDTMVMQYESCHEAISGKDYTVDYSSCSSTCTLYWFWLGVRYLKNEYSWQIYKACVLFRLRLAVLRVRSTSPQSSTFKLSRKVLSQGDCHLPQQSIISIVVLR